MTAKRIVISGASGLIGGRLVPFLESSGYEVTRLVRRPARNAGEDQWYPAQGVINPHVLSGADAVINFSGVSITGKRWSEARKQEIRRSRLEATGLLAETIAGLEHKPSVFISTSATGFYGDGGSETLTEQSPNGAGFLAEVCKAWESAADPAVQAGVRVVHPRLGVVLASEGGMLLPLKRLFGLGLGGRIGNGHQYMSWIDIDDLVRALAHLLVDSKLDGPVNAVAPNPLMNCDFATTLGTAVGRPTFIPAPEFAVRAVMGQMAEELILVSQRAVPARLLDTGFEFQSAMLERSLQRQLSRPTGSVPTSSVARAA
jgi:uncharacterized protein (TIGR01777 family)